MASMTGPAWRFPINKIKINPNPNPYKNIVFYS
jgi:hypothetical protein